MSLPTVLPFLLRLLRMALLHRPALHRSNHHLTSAGKPLLLQPEPNPRPPCIVKDANMSGAPPVPNGCTTRPTNMMPGKHALPLASLLVSLLAHHFQPPPLPLPIQLPAWPLSRPWTRTIGFPMVAVASHEASVEHFNGSGLHSSSQSCH
jgi:hypothetical protein